MPIDVYRGDTPLATPPICRRPDPIRARSWLVQVCVEDYLLSGNAILRVTARDSTGWPVSVEWLPANWVYIQMQTGLYGTETDVDYFYLGELLPYDDIIHVRRGADRLYPVRGVGVVEQHLDDLDRIAMESAYESGSLAGGAVPSIAVITPNQTLTKDVADEAKADWMVKFSGPTREPVFLPNGTQIVPLGWSPSDTQLTEARKLSLTDVANIFNIDGYWLGAPVAGMTYRTSGPQYQQVLRTSLEPVLADFEDVWSDAWLPRGQNIRFDRNQLLRDDLATTSTAMVALVGAGILTPEEARQYLASGAVTMPTSPFAAAAAGGVVAEPPAPAEVEPAPAP
jgi:HK97 family phage portal protein